VTQSPYLGWSTFIDPASIARVKIECRHLEMVRGRHAEALAAFMEKRAKAALGSR
jgi:thioesterase domain-containing protein